MELSISITVTLHHCRKAIFWFPFDLVETGDQPVLHHLNTIKLYSKSLKDRLGNDLTIFGKLV